MRLPLVALALSALLPACSMKESPVASLSRATMIPGTALGPVALGRMTLAGFVEEYGPGRCALLAGDDFCGIELMFEGGEMVFLWELDAQEAYALADPPITHAPRGIEAFLEAHPRLGLTKLHSVSVKASDEPMDTFYHGSIDGRAKLFAGLGSVLGYMERASDDAPGFVAGASEHLPPMRMTSYANGLTVYLVTPEGGGEPYIARMTIFQPQGAL